MISINAYISDCQCEDTYPYGNHKTAGVTINGFHFSFCYDELVEGAEEELEKLVNDLNGLEI